MSQFVVDCEFFKKEARSIQLPVTHLFSFGKYFGFLSLSPAFSSAPVIE